MLRSVGLLAYIRSRSFAIGRLPASHRYEDPNYRRPPRRCQEFRRSQGDLTRNDGHPRHHPGPSDQFNQLPLCRARRLQVALGRVEARVAEHVTHAAEFLPPTVVAFLADDRLKAVDWAMTSGATMQQRAVFQECKAFEPENVAGITWLRSDE
jgi:hypothetical protein